VSKLVGDDAGGKAERVADLMQMIAELTNECFFSARTSQEPPIARQWIQGTKELEASDKFTHKGIHGDHTFCFEFSEWHVNSPLIRAGGAQAVEGQIGTFTDTHAGVANQQKGIATKIVAAEEFLLQELVLLCREWARKSLREAREVLAADQMGKIRKLFHPRQFLADAAQSEEQVAIGCGHKRRYLRTQAGHPTEDVGITTQLVQALHLRMIGAEIAQEVASRSAVTTSRVGTERNSEGINRAVEERSQSPRMLERRTSRAVHEEEAFGRGRMCCATARAYSR